MLSSTMSVVTYVGKSGRGDGVLYKGCEKGVLGMIGGDYTMEREKD